VLSRRRPWDSEDFPLPSWATGYLACVDAMADRELEDKSFVREVMHEIVSTARNSTHPRVDTVIEVDFRPARQARAA
jgi:hypothetical protein